VFIKGRRNASGIACLAAFFFFFLGGGGGGGFGKKRGEVGFFFNKTP